MEPAPQSDQISKSTLKSVTQLPKSEYKFSTSIFQLIHRAAKFGTHSKDAVDEKFSNIL